MAILEVTNLSKAFGGLEAIKDLSFELRKGEILGIIGPNGAGKTTLFNMVAGFYRSDTGRIRFKGEDITDFRPHQICNRGLVRTFQITQPFAELTVLENVKIGAYARIPSNREATRTALQLLEAVGLSGKQNDRHQRR